MDVKINKNGSVHQEAEGVKLSLAAESIPFNAPSLVGEEFFHIADAIRRGQLSGDGHYTKLCEIWLKNKTGALDALLTILAQRGLEMAALLCDLGPGDEVIMPSFTFVSTANAVALRGAVPVFVDIDPITLNICPEKHALPSTEKTKAIFVVHYAGVLADMDAFNEMARDHDLFVVEDAAQALGSTLNGRQAGSLGDLATFSFHETKNVISGEGGALLINNPALKERAEIIREKGTNRSQFFRGQVDKYTWVDIGSSYLPGELIAAFLYAQLAEEEKIFKRRLDIWNRYDEELREFADQFGVACPRTSDGYDHNGHMYYLVFPDLEKRQAFIAGMKEQGITTPFHYVPLHSSPGGAKFARTAGDMTGDKPDFRTLVRLPIFYGLVDQDRVIGRVKELIAQICG